MPNESLLTYIRERMAAGSPKDDIVKDLIANGWQIPDINAGFSALETSTVPSAPVTPAPAISVSMSVVNNAPKRNVLGIVAAVLAILLVGGGGFYAYAMFFSAPPARTILERSIATLATAKTFAGAATTTLSVTARNVGALAGLGMASSSIQEKIFVAGGGVFDISSPARPAYDVTSNIQASINDATTTGSAKIVTQNIVKDQKFYVKLLDFNLTFSSSDPRLALAQFFVGIANGMAGTLKNKWIEADATSTAAVVPIDATTTAATLEGNIAAFKEYASGMSYLISVDTKGTENVQGIPTYHLQAVLKGDQKLVDLIRKSIVDGQPSAAGTADLDKAMQGITRVVTQEVHVDLWIGKSDYHLYKVVFSPTTFSFDLTGGGTADAALEGEISYAQYDKPVSIVAPPDARPLQEVIQEIFSVASN